MFSTLGDNARKEHGHDNDMCEGAEALLAALLDAGADVNASNNSSRRLAHVLAEFGAYSVLRFAVDCGADLDALTSEGHSAWHYLGQWCDEQLPSDREPALERLHALHQHNRARLLAERDAAVAELRRELEALPQGLWALVVGAAVEVRRLNAVCSAGEAAASEPQGRASAADTSAIAAKAESRRGGGADAGGRGADGVC
jgi:hypothetical protein